MSACWQVLIYELRHLTEKKSFWALVCVAPILTFFVLYLLFGDGYLRELPIAVCDSDHTPTSREILRKIDALPSVKIVEQVLNPTEGEAMLRRGDIYAFIYIPNNYEMDVQRNRPVRITAWLNGQHMSVAGMINRDLTDLSAALWKDLDTQMRIKGGVSPHEAHIQSSTINLAIRPVDNPNLNYRIFLLSGLVPAVFQLLVMLMAVLSISETLHPEKSKKLLTVAKGNIFALYAGKILAILCMYSVLALVLYFILLMQGDLVLHGDVFLMGSCFLLFLCASFAPAFLIVGLAPSKITALSAVSVVSSPSFAFSGITFPIQSMPLLAKIFANCLPLTHFLALQVHVGQHGASFYSQISSFNSLLLIIIICLVIGYPLVVWKFNRMYSANLVPAEGV